MNFTVIWRRALLPRLAEFYVNALERGQDAAAVTRAVAEIDQRLGGRPETQGESRGEFERVLIVWPLSVSFEVHEDERVVYVLRVRYAPGRPRAD